MLLGIIQLYLTKKVEMDTMKEILLNKYLLYLMNYLELFLNI